MTCRLPPRVRSEVNGWSRTLWIGMWTPPEVWVVQGARKEWEEEAAAAGGNKRENRRWRLGNDNGEVQQRLLVSAKGLGSPG